MSAEARLDLDVDLEANRAEGTIAIAIDELFVDGFLQLWEYTDGWEGYLLEDGAFYHVDTRLDTGDWRRCVRVGERAVRLAIERHIANPDAGGVGVFERRCSA